eukprot:CAMPEP_0178518132 /NCGR_PEP_ID=MMETSP0696-20121128/26084_1 /TAXON_ID=265572 /ORGANISM="Extubocellulus spinifer, Strain CCMP396" /LENGTH=305 /DNA_ID=CAMNT_0020148655 /DNA_START=201 /DNA_END=1118 /DNA_ORIENTATION=-
MTTSGSYLVPIKTDSSASLNGMTKSGSAQMLAEKGVSLPRAHSSQLLATQQQDVELSGGIKLTWEPRVERMIRERFEAADHTPFMVGLVGIPGSGKSTSCDILASLLSSSSNGVDGEEEPISNIVIPMDGYHYSVADLQKMDNPDDKIYRRGAPDTFDAAGLKRDLQRIAHGKERIVKMPGFDHAKGDPEPDEHVFIRDEHKIVMCEGLYLVHDSDGWEGIVDEFDFTVFINSDVDICIDRLKIRNKCIPGYTPDEIEFRCDAVDRVNANTVMRSIDRADVVVESAAAMAAAAAADLDLDEECFV